MANENPNNPNQNGRRVEPLRSAAPLPAAPGTFATISLESVESMLREPSSAPAAAPANVDIPPPLHGPSPQRSPAAPVAAAPPRFRYSSLVREDGSIDIPGIYRIGRVPDLPVSAEQLLSALNSLPPELPTQARQVVMKATVTSLIGAAGISLDTIVADARLRHTRLQQFFDGLAKEQEDDIVPLRRDIAELEAALQTKRAQLAHLEGSRKGHHECARRIHGLEEVIAVLTES